MAVPTKISAKAPGAARAAAGGLLVLYVFIEGSFELYDRKQAPPLQGDNEAGEPVAGGVPTNVVVNMYANDQVLNMGVTGSAETMDQDNENT